MANQLPDFFKDKEEWEAFISSVNVRKIVNPYDKAWVQKIKKHYKTYGWEMNLYPDQKKRLEMIKEEIDKAAK